MDRYVYTFDYFSDGSDFWVTEYDLKKQRHREHTPRTKGKWRSGILGHDVKAEKDSVALSQRQADIIIRAFKLARKRNKQ
jgi:hypothetical protein